MHTRFLLAAGWALGLFLTSAAPGASLFTRVRYTETVTGTSSASVGDKNWITAGANAFHAQAVDQYHYFNGSPVTSSRVDGIISDTYTLNGNGLNTGEIVPVTIDFDVDYFVEVTGTSGYTYQLLTHLTGDASASATYSYSRDFQGAINTSGNPDVSFSQTINWVVGTSKNLAFDMLLYSSGSGSSDPAGPTMSQSTQVIVHAENTATIGFTFPQGTTMTSQLGWTPVPEPAALGVIGLAGLCIAARRRRD